MTHDILQSDIDLAIKMREAQHPDDEIILALTQRRVDPAKAAQLLEDLHKGIKPTPLSAIPMEFTMPRRSRSRSTPSSTRPTEPRRVSRSKSRHEPSAQRAAEGGKKSPGLRIGIALLALLVIAVIVAVLFQHWKESRNDLEDQAPKPAKTQSGQALPPIPTKPAMSPPRAAPGPLALELQPDGLHLGGSLVNGGNVLTTAANLLGVATRTNQLPQTDVVVYAYDRQGLLIYFQKSGGTNRIVLDCDASGGANGTTTAFAGTLKIGNQVIGPATDSKTLGAITKLGLTHAGAGDSFWRGRYSGLELLFAYLTSPQRLSLIQIDLN